MNCWPETHSHKSIFQCPSSVEVEEILFLEDGLTQPISKKIDDNVDDSLSGHGFLTEGIFIRGPGVKWDAHSNFSGGPTPSHAVVNIDYGENDVPKADSKECEVEYFGSECLTILILFEKELNKLWIIF
mmetsp:Transcript_24231/g.51152  ORF Transcript_24231/g.51152 Transcript_24231/m.51152 type:complete len:129 (+) Transcript_24231:1789-2175(+)